MVWGLGSWFRGDIGIAEKCVAVCCSVLQCVAVCCSVSQCVAVCCSALQCVALWFRGQVHGPEASVS